MICVIRSVFRYDNQSLPIHLLMAPLAGVVSAETVMEAQARTQRHSVTLPILLPILFKNMIDDGKMQSNSFNW